MAEEQTDGIDWERFSQDKLYRALTTERGLPPPLPEDFQIDFPRLRVDLGYSTMIFSRGFERSTEREAEITRIAQEQRRQCRGSPDDLDDERPEKVVSIADPRFKVRRPRLLSAPR